MITRKLAKSIEALGAALTILGAAISVLNAMAVGRSLSLRMPVFAAGATIGVGLALLVSAVIMLAMLSKERDRKI